MCPRFLGIFCRETDRRELDDAAVTTIPSCRRRCRLPKNRQQLAVIPMFESRGERAEGGRHLARLIARVPDLLRD